MRTARSSGSSRSVLSCRSTSLRAQASGTRAGPLLGQVSPRSGVVHRDSEGVGARYGAREVWRQLQREGIEVAGCTVERLIRLAGPKKRGQSARSGVRPSQMRTLPAQPIWWIAASTPTPRTGFWLADPTSVPTWSGFVCAAFVVDAFSRFVVALSVTNSLRIDLALNALKQALWARRPDTTDPERRLVHHSGAAKGPGPARVRHPGVLKLVQSILASVCNRSLQSAELLRAIYALESLLSLMRTLRL